MKSLLQNTRLQIMLLVLVLTGSGFYAWWVYKYQPRQTEIVEFQDREDELQRANQKAREAVANIGVDRIRESINAYDEQADQVAGLVPSADRNINLLPLITRTADQHNMTVEAMTPLDPTTQSGFQTRGLNITVIGNYHDVGAFMTSLLSLEHITQIHRASIQALAQGDTPSGGSPVEELTRTRPVEATFEFRLFQAPESTPGDPDGGEGGDGDGESGSDGGES